MQKIWADDPTLHSRPHLIGVPPDAVSVVAGYEYRYGQ